MRRLARAFVYIFIFFILFLLFSHVFYAMKAENSLSFAISGEDLGEEPVKVYYLPVGTADYSEQNAIAVSGESGKTSYNIKLDMPEAALSAIRIDFPEKAGLYFALGSIDYSHGTKAMHLSLENADGLCLNGLEYDEYIKDGGLWAVFKTTGNDPYIIIDDLPLKPVDRPSPFYALAAALVLTFVIYRFVHLKKIAAAARDILAQRKLITSLAVNDFKTRFAGSYFGVIWAFVQPICTILVFWFVFQVGFRNPNVGNVQYILWFMTGLIPWFFFSEAWNSATNAFIEYSYLVKKVVFQINILPMIKILSALFIHLFFVVFMMVVYAFYGRLPNLYYIQIIYYMFCMIVLVCVLSFITAPLVIFFRDISQIMSIILQFGMWLTPIMWSVDNLPRGMGGFANIFKINPMYYIVQGYRNSMIYHVPFWDNILQTVYFWTLILVLAIVGNTLYTKLKPHFADVL